MYMDNFNQITDSKSAGYPKCEDKDVLEGLRLSLYNFTK